MKTCVLCLAVLSLVPAAVFGQQVAEEELKIEARADFVNFEGPQREYPAQVIRDIGGTLSRRLLAGEPVGRYAAKYTVTHVFDEAQPERLGSDIISFERDAKVNHINSVRLILTGFLESHYGYSRSQAEVLAVFTTHYNAVFRGNMEYFGRKYQDAVIDRLRPESAGLSRRYDQWPGATQILIPLTKEAGREEVRSIETSELTEEEVVEDIREKEDKGVEERKRMTELKEEQVAASEEEAEKERLALEEKRKEIAERERRLEREDQPAKEKAGAESPPEQQDQGERERLEQQQRDQEEQRLAEEKKELEEREEELKEEQERTDDKKEEIARDRESIEKDEELIAKREEIEKDPEKAAREMLETERELREVARREPIAAGTLYYMKVNRYLVDGHYANDLYRINASTGEFVSKAPDRPHIAGHKYEVIPDRGVLVLTHGEGREAHHLTLLDLVTLELVTAGETEIYHKSFIETRGDFVYAINFRDDNDFRLGKYDAESLEMVAETRESIDKNTVFHMHESSIFVNRKDKRVLVLDAGDLTVRNLVDLP